MKSAGRAAGRAFRHVTVFQGRISMSHRQFAPARRALAVAFLVAIPSFVSAQPIVVDGNLADFEALSTPLVASDAAFDVSPRMRSGFDFTRVLVHYYPKADTLYLGLDFLDSEGGPGVVGDADGDSDPNARTHPEVRTDQFGVGQNEYYVFEIDTDNDGNFSEYGDLRVRYKDNRLSLERGDGHREVAPGLSARIAIGTRGVPFDPRLPNQNRSTDDLEIAIFGYANQDDAPRTFGVRVRAGSSVDSLPDDVSDDPIEYAFGEVLEFRVFFPDPDQRRLGDCAVAFPGDVVTVAARVTNHSRAALRPAWMIFHFPTGFEYVSGSVANAEEGRMIPTEDGKVIRFVRPGGDATLEPGESATVTFNVALVSFPTCHMTIRAYAEGVLASDGETCVFSCLEALCFVE
jgi:hypothetical protein